MAESLKTATREFEKVYMRDSYQTDKTKKYFYFLAGFKAGMVYESEVAKGIMEEELK